MTKKHETAFATDIDSAISFYSENEPKGECVLVIEGKSFDSIAEDARAKWLEMSVEEHMEFYLSKGADKKSAMKAVAADRGVKKQEIYKILNIE